MLPGTSWYQSTKTLVLPRKEKALTDERKKSKIDSHRTVTVKYSSPADSMKYSPNFSSP